MPSQFLSNYLRRERRKRGLTQDELAWLVGFETADGTCISRYERFQRQPTVDVMLACQFIFDAEIGSLFAGTYDNVKFVVSQRAAELTAQVEKQRPGPARDRKLEILRALVEAGDDTTND
jgi:transcriptional regulator with XRE-family HTH domain